MILDTPDYFVKTDIGKMVDSSDHNFLLSVLILILVKFDFGENFIYWIEILLND